MKSSLDTKRKKMFSDDNSYFSRNHFWDWSFVWIFFFVKLDIVQQWSADWVLLSLSCNWKEICLVFYHWFICWDQKVFEIVFHNSVWSPFVSTFDFLFDLTINWYAEEVACIRLFLILQAVCSAVYTFSMKNS